MNTVLDEIAKDMVRLAREVMASSVGINSKTSANTLIDSDLYKQIETQITANGEVEISLLFNYYLEYIEWDRPPEHGKMPPIDAIISWMKKKHISPTNGNIRSAAFAISKAIWKDGWKGRKITANLLIKTEQAWDSWADKLFNEIIKNLNDYFNADNI